MKKRALIGLWLALVAAPAVPAAAQPDNGTLSLQVENDYFTPENRDRHYSNGIRAAWLPAASAPGDEGPIERFAVGLPVIGGPDRTVRVGWSFGQSLFTPQDLTRSDPIRNDRPYAGWLYAGLNLLGEHTAASTQSGTAVLNELDTLAIELGVVGRAALGKQVQSGFHATFFSNEDPKGWRNQLKSEPGLLISYDHKWRGLVQTSYGGWGADFTPDVGLTLGNVEDDVAIGFTVRFGRDLPADYGPPRIRPGLIGSDFFESPTTVGRDFGWYIFAGAEGRAVGRNIFLDGNSFATSLSVPKKVLVGDLQAGLALIIRGVRLTYSLVVRSPEFDGQRGPDAFGALSASFNF